MKIVKIKDIENTSRDVNFTGGNSQRMVLESDNIGFAMMKTNIRMGGPYHWHYPKHLEACYCIEGVGILTNLETKEKYAIKPGTTYILDKHDNHTFEAITNVVLISVFNPPLKGSETHDENGNYE